VGGGGGGVKTSDNTKTEQDFVKKSYMSVKDSKHACIENRLRRTDQRGAGLLSKCLALEVYTIETAP
jgi:hypothetical protein